GPTRIVRQRPENVDAVFRRQSREFWHIGGRRHGLAHLHDEVSETTRRTAQQHSRGGIAEYFEAVRKVARPEHIRTSPGHLPVAVAHEGHFALEHIKRFVLEMM